MFLVATFSLSKSKVAKAANFCGYGIGGLAVQNLVSKVAK